MKDINLPITQTFSLTIDTHNIDMSNATELDNGQLFVPLDDVINVYKNPETEDDDNVSDKPDVKDGDMKVDIVKRLKSDILNALGKNEWVRIDINYGYSRF